MSSFFSRSSKATPTPAPLDPKAEAGKELLKLMREIQTGKKSKNDLKAFLDKTNKINMDYQGDEGYTALDIAGTLTDKSIKELLKNKGASKRKRNHNNEKAAANAAAPKKPWFSSSAPAPPSNNTRKMKSKYKIFETVKNNYKPMPVGKRGFSGKAVDKHFNTIWALDTENPLLPATIKEAKKRYTKLLGEIKKGSNDSERITEMLTIYKLLKKKGQIEGLESPGSEPNATVYTDNYLKSLPANSHAAPSPNHSVALNANLHDPSYLLPNGNAHSNNAGDPTIERTIQRMKCTVCESQKIISNALKNGKGPAKCDICGEKAVVPVAVPTAANMFGSTNFSTNGSRNNANKGANAAAAAKAPSAANMFGSTNFSTNGSRNNANKGANAAAAAKAPSAANVNLSKLRKVTNDNKRQVWVDKQGKKAYIIKNRKQVVGKLVGPDKYGDYYIDMPDEDTVWLSNNNIKLRNAPAAAAAAPAAAAPAAAAAAPPPAIARPANNAPAANWIAYHKSQGKTNNDPLIMALKRQLNPPAPAPAAAPAAAAAAAAPASSAAAPAPLAAAPPRIVSRIDLSSVTGPTGRGNKARVYTLKLNYDKLIGNIAKLEAGNRISNNDNNRLKQMKIDKEKIENELIGLGASMSGGTRKNRKNRRNTRRNTRTSRR